ncbi:MAG TPA: hypothetical protein VFU10_11955 [Gaiellaceae bacterium]|nr:hypothetical protein [Gaiellaceae bacterium]
MERAPASANRVALPHDAHEPFEVYINGVAQQQGADYVIEDGTLVFNRPLAQEGKLGFWRWLSMLLGIAGTYRKHETVDVIYTRAGRKVVASGLPFVSDA